MSTFTQSRGSRVRSYRSLLAHQAAITERKADDANLSYQRNRRHLPVGGRVLDIGCGTRPGTVILHHTAGDDATGIDFDDPRSGVAGVLGQLRRNGAERAVKTIARRALFDRRYYARLESLYGAPLRRDIDVRPMDARRLDFPTSEFDLIFSVAVFEHIGGVEEACAEIARVLKPGGVALIGLHLFRSLSGGHHFAWADVTRPPVFPPPWDHLRDELAPADGFLNRLRAEEFLDVFHRHFDVEDVHYTTEGEALVTDAILTETGCSVEDLTRRTLSVRLRSRRSERGG